MAHAGRFVKTTYALRERPAELGLQLWADRESQVEAEAEWSAIARRVAMGRHLERATRVSRATPASASSLARCRRGPCAADDDDKWRTGARPQGQT